MKKIFLNTFALSHSRGLLLALVLLLSLSGLALAEQNEFPEPGTNDDMALLVNINIDDAEKMAELLTGVGVARAEAIVQYRETHGHFEQIDDLVSVSGIGPATLENNRALLTVTATE
ncbi:MAG: helix-hairpin-helix domain-containing protein [Natronospirillum sp.]